MDSRVRALYKIAPRPEGPALARRIIAEEVGPRVPAPVLDDLQLMVSELVTNGIVHGSTGGEDPVLLDLCVNGDIRCRVLDRGECFGAPTPREGPGGWGLQVVEQLSDRWGLERSPHRTEVWFEWHGA